MISDYKSNGYMSKITSFVKLSNIYDCAAFFIIAKNYFSNNKDIKAERIMRSCELLLLEALDFINYFVNKVLRVIA